MDVSSNLSRDELFGLTEDCPQRSGSQELHVITEAQCTVVCLTYTKIIRLDAGGNIKVADFGLSEDVYTTGYFRQGRDDNVKLPFKWMAPESMTDGVFNEKTDVVCTEVSLSVIVDLFVPSYTQSCVSPSF